MLKKRNRYSPEYKREIVKLVRRSGSSCRQIAREVGLNSNPLARLVREADAGGGKACPGGGARDEAQVDLFACLELFHNPRRRRRVARRDREFSALTQPSVEMGRNPLQIRIVRQHL
jgi:transposase-like protein